MGLPILCSNLSGPTINVTGKNCVIASCIIDASPIDKKQKYLIKVDGFQTRIFDVFMRTQRFNGPKGNKDLYKDGVSVDTMLYLSQNAKFSYLENIWLWRGDKCPCKNPCDGYDIWPCAKFQEKNINNIGLQVDARDVSATCLMVEHQKNPIIWNGDNGYIMFIQGEGAYTSEVVSYLTIGKNVKKFTLRGGNMYSQFGTKHGGNPTTPAITILSDNIDNYDFDETSLGSWATFGPGGYVNGIIQWKDKKYGARLLPDTNGKGSKFTICNIQKLLSSNLNKSYGNNIKITASNILDKSYPAGFKDGQGALSVVPCNSTNLYDGSLN